MARRIAAASLVLVPLLLTACADQKPKPQPTEEPYVGASRMNDMNSTGQPPATNDRANPDPQDPAYAAGDNAELKPEAKPKAPPKSKATSKSRTYVVQKGDTLEKIAKKFYNDGSQWKKIQNANKSKVPDPNKLKIGTRLVIP